MALLAHSNSATLGQGLNKRLHLLRLRFDRVMEAQRERRRIARELNTYSDEELAEFGFSRSDIPAVAAGNFRR